MAGGFRRWSLRIAVLVGALFLVIQLVPYGWVHSNPPISRDAPWPSETSEVVASRRVPT